MRSFIMLVALGAALLLDVTIVYAQSASCSQLQSNLRKFDRNSDFANMGGNSRAARDLQRQVQAAESSYVRSGCNADAKAGRKLSRECQGIGRTVLRLRREYSDVSQSVQTANAVAQQRESILQEMARFGCNSGSSATFSRDRQSVFDRVFGDGQGQYRDGDLIEDGDYWGHSGTVRTVCVRLSDGYFWPVSYATLPNLVGTDAATCKVQCPGAEVDIYYYDNPGQEPEQMRNMFNQPYSALPNAFRYRREFDKTSTCKANAPTNVTTIATSNGLDRQIAAVGEMRFPLPLRDPRQSSTRPVAAPAAVQPIMAPLETAQLADIPLPRPRPQAPGETPIAQPVQQAGSDMRLVQFGDKVVRVVGPNTPYAQPIPAGT